MNTPSPIPCWIASVSWLISSPAWLATTVAPTILSEAVQQRGADVIKAECLVRSFGGLGGGRLGQHGSGRRRQLWD